MLQIINNSEYLIWHLFLETKLQQHHKEKIHILITSNSIFDLSVFFHQLQFETSPSLHPYPPVVQLYV